MGRNSKRLASGNAARRRRGATAPRRFCDNLYQFNRWQAVQGLKRLWIGYYNHRQSALPHLRYMHGRIQRRRAFQRFPSDFGEAKAKLRRLLLDVPWADGGNASKQNTEAFDAFCRKDELFSCLLNILADVNKPESRRRANYIFDRLCPHPATQSVTSVTSKSSSSDAASLSINNTDSSKMVTAGEKRRASLDQCLLPPRKKVWIRRGKRV